MTPGKLKSIYRTMWKGFAKYRAKGYPRPKLVITESIAGVAVWGPVSPWFSIPKRVMTVASPEFAIYYVAHELAHQYCRC